MTSANPQHCLCGSKQPYQQCCQGYHDGTNVAQRAEDLDEAAIMKAKEEAENAFHDKSDTIDYAKARAALAETAAQLQTLQRLRKRGGR